MSDVFSPFSFASFAIAIAATLAGILLVATRYSSLPEQIPMHYGASGRPDKWAGKGSMWVLALMPVLTLLVMLGATAAMVTTTEDRDEVRAGVRFVAPLTAYLSLGTFVLTVRMLAVAEKRAEGIGRWFLPLFMAGLLLVIFLFR